MSTSGSPSKSPKGKSGGRGNAKRKKTAGGGRTRESDRRAGSRRTTVFKTDSIGVSPNDIAKATSLTIEVENRVGEGFIAQALLKTFHNPVSRAKLVAFLKEHEPHAVAQGWSVPSSTATATGNSADQVMAVLSLLAAQNNPSGINSTNLPGILSAFGISGATAAVLRPPVTPPSAPSASRSDPLLELVRNALTPKATSGTGTTTRAATAPSGNLNPAPASAGAVLALSGSNGSSASSVTPVTRVSPGPAAKDTVRNIAKMLLSRLMTMEEARMAAAECNIEFARVLQSLQSQRDHALKAQPFEGRSETPVQPSSRQERAGGLSSTVDFSSMGTLDISTELRDTANDFGLRSGASSAASSRQASPARDFESFGVDEHYTEHDVTLCIRQFFSRRNGDISRSKLKDFLKTNRAAMERSGFTLEDLPSAGAGFARNIPETVMRDSAATCAHYMFDKRPGLWDQLRCEAQTLGDKAGESDSAGPRRVSFNTPSSPCSTASAASSSGPRSRSRSRSASRSGSASGSRSGSRSSSASGPSGFTFDSASGSGSGYASSSASGYDHDSDSFSSSSTSGNPTEFRPGALAPAPSSIRVDSSASSVAASQSRSRSEKAAGGRSLVRALEKDVGFSAQPGEPLEPPLPKRQRKERELRETPTATAVTLSGPAPSGASAADALDVSQVSATGRPVSTSVLDFFMPSGGTVLTGPNQQPVRPTAVGPSRSTNPSVATASSAARNNPSPAPAAVVAAADPSGSAPAPASLEPPPPTTTASLPLSTPAPALGTGNAGT